MTNHGRKTKFFVALLLAVFLVFSALIHQRLTVTVSDQAGRASPAKSPITAAAVASLLPLAPVNDFGPVVRVIDGDTLAIKLNGREERVRLLGINAPETVDPKMPVQCFGPEASNRAKDLLTGQTVRLELDPSQGRYDKYGRLLAYVWLADGTNVNLKMIQDGYAYEYTYDLPYKYQAEFKTAEFAARTANRGLWSPETCSSQK